MSPAWHDVRTLASSATTALHGGCCVKPRSLGAPREERCGEFEGGGYLDRVKVVRQVLPSGEATAVLERCGVLGFFVRGAPCIAGEGAVGSVSVRHARFDEE